MEVEKLVELLGLQRVKFRDDEVHASCPFPERHTTGSDKHPSFSLNVEKGVYNCFSCGSRGTIEELVSEVNGLSIGEAILRLEEIGFGALERELREKPEEQVPEVLPEGLLYYFDEVEDDVAELYHGEIEGRDCLVFPVRRKDGRLVGAIARSTTDHFHKNLWHIKKKQYVYGEDKIELEQPVVIVEGPRDAIALWKSGVPNAVALMGMAISNEQVEKLLSLSSEFIVWMDKDKAGSEGMRRIVKKMENRARMLYIDPWKQVPSDCKDARDVFTRYGAEKVQEIVNGAKTFIMYVMEDTLLC